MGGPPQNYLFRAFRRAAQNAFMRSEAAFRSAADIGGRPLRFVGTPADGVGGYAVCDFGGRPRLFTPPPNASIARLIRSRSARRAATICSIDMKGW